MKPTKLYHCTTKVICEGAEMINPPKTLEEAQSIRYNKWAGNPKGYPYNHNKCAYEICWRPTRSRGQWLSYQCSRKPGHGPGELYCKQHARMINPK